LLAQGAVQALTMQAMGALLLPGLPAEAALLPTEAAWRPGALPVQVRGMPGGTQGFQGAHGLAAQPLPAALGSRCCRRHQRVAVV
jgi:hypothetical protein